MNIQNRIVYTVPVWDSNRVIRLQQATSLLRDRKLTDAGAQRIIRRLLNPKALVISVEAIGLEKIK